MKIDEARKYVVNSLGKAFRPRTLAVIGASHNKEKVGYKVVQALQESDYAGEIFPVNINGGEIAGLKTYKSLDEIPGEIDLAFISLPAKLVYEALEMCIKKEVGVAVVSSSGFTEAGNSEEQDRIVRLVRENELPLIGPNLIGIGTPYFNFNCGFIPYLPNKGRVAIISQSGSNLLAALGSSQVDHFGISMFVGLGNKADVDFSEMMKYADQDENTGCIAVYIEGLDSPEAFKKAALEIEKPIVAIKVGTSKIGVKATFAHTASVNRDDGDILYERLFEDAGVIRAHTWLSFLDASLALGCCPPMYGENIVIVTNGGGAGILACDHFERKGMPMKELKDISDELPEKMRHHMPGFGSPLNPIDISGTASPEMYEGAIEEAFLDDNVDGIMVSICPTAVTDVPAITNKIIELVTKYEHKKTPLIMEAQGGGECYEAILKLRDLGIPAYRTPEQAVNAMISLREYGRIKSN